MTSDEGQEAVWVRDGIIQVHGDELRPGEQVEWRADELGPSSTGAGVVRPGDVGIYITDDGAREPVEAVVRFAGAAFVCDARSVRKAQN